MLPDDIFQFAKSVLTQPDSVAIISAGFPRELEENVLGALTVVPAASYIPFGGLLPAVVVDGSQLTLLNRVNNPYKYVVPNAGWHTHARWQLSERQQDILACVYSSHCDGLVRMQQINRLVHSRELWAVPYLLKLLCEYVVEIGELVDARANHLDAVRYKSFAQANPDFMRRINSRVVSFWNANYRRPMHWGDDAPHYASLSDYPAYRVLFRLGIWSPREARNLLGRAASVANHVQFAG